MDLNALRHRLLEDVCSKRSAAAFDEARSRHPALACHESVTSLLELMAQGAREGYAEREAIVRTLLAEQHARPREPLWSSLLICTCFPMLAKLRFRIVGFAFPARDLDQLVVSSFLEVTCDFWLAELADRTCMRLRQMTQRRVFAAIRAEQAERKLIRPVDLQNLEHLIEAGTIDNVPYEQCLDSRPERGVASEPDRELAERLADVIVERARGHIEPDRLDMVLATVVRGELLKDYLDRRLGPLTGAERQRVHQRHKRMRTRTLVRIRALFAETDWLTEDNRKLLDTWRLNAGAVREPPAAPKERAEPSSPRRDTNESSSSRTAVPAAAQVRNDR